MYCFTTQRCPIKMEADRKASLQSVSVAAPQFHTLLQGIAWLHLFLPCASTQGMLTGTLTTIRTDDGQVILSEVADYSLAVHQGPLEAGLLNEDATLLQYRDVSIVSTVSSGQTKTVKASRLVSLNPRSMSGLLHQALFGAEGSQLRPSTQQVSDIRLRVWALKSVYGLLLPLHQLLTAHSYSMTQLPVVLDALSSITRVIRRYSNDSNSSDSIAWDLILQAEGPVMIALQELQRRQFSAMTNEQFMLMLTLLSAAVKGVHCLLPVLLSQQQQQQHAQQQQQQMLPLQVEPGQQQQQLLHQQPAGHVEPEQRNGQQQQQQLLPLQLTGQVEPRQHAQQQQQEPQQQIQQQQQQPQLTGQARPEQRVTRQQQLQQQVQQQQQLLQLQPTQQAKLKQQHDTQRVQHQHIQPQLQGPSSQKQPPQRLQEPAAPVGSARPAAAYAAAAAAATADVPASQPANKRVCLGLAAAETVRADTDAVMQAAAKLLKQQQEAKATFLKEHKMSLTEADKVAASAASAVHTALTARGQSCLALRPWLLSSEPIAGTRKWARRFGMIPAVVAEFLTHYPDLVIVGLPEETKAADGQPTRNQVLANPHVRLQPGFRQVLLESADCKILLRSWEQNLRQLAEDGNGRVDFSAAAQRTGGSPMPGELVRYRKLFDSFASFAAAALGDAFRCAGTELVLLESDLDFELP